MKRVPGWVIVITVLAISFVLRPPVAQIGPIIQQIQNGLAISDSQTAILAALPVLCFGFGAFASPALVRRFGVNQTLVSLLGLLFVSIAVRPFLGYYGLLLGTTLAGLAIAVANVLLPSVVRGRFPKHVVVLTSAYTTILAASASFSAAISFPSTAIFGWQWSLAMWALPTLLAALLSLSLLRGDQAVSESETLDHSQDSKLVLRSPIAWSIVGLFGIQSLGFYALLAWLPTLAVDGGLTPSDAGALLSLMTFVGVPVGLILSVNFARFKSLALAGVLISMVTIAGMILLLAGQWVAAAIVIGIGQASSFPLSLSLISTRAANQRLTTMLSSMAQGIGYLISAAGTFLFGWLATVTGGWQLSVITLIALTAIQAAAAWFAGKPNLIK